MKTLLAALALLACAGNVVAGCPPRFRYAAPYYTSYQPCYPASYYAQPSYTAAVSYQPVYQAAVAELVTPSVTTFTQFIPIAVPQFSAGFSGAAVQQAGVAQAGVAQAGVSTVGTAGGVAAAAPAAPPAAAQPTNADLLKAIVGINDSLKNTDGRLQRLEAKVFGEPEVVAPPPDPKTAPPPGATPPPPDPKDKPPAPPVMPSAVDPKNGQSALQLKGRQVVTAKCAACHDAATAARKGEGFQLTAEGYPITLTADKARKVVAKVRAGEMPPAHPLPEDERAAVVANYESN